MENSLNVRIQHAVEHIDNEGIQFPANNSVPINGEIIFNRDRSNFKVGDGSSQYSALTNMLLQSDWNQTNPNLKDYIKNKPVIYEDLVFTKTFGVSESSKLESTIQGMTVDIGGINCPNRKFIVVGNTTFNSQPPDYIVQDTSTLAPDYYTPQVTDNLNNLAVYYYLDLNVLASDMGFICTLLSSNLNKMYEFIIHVTRSHNFSPYLCLLMPSTIQNLTRFVTTKNITFSSVDGRDCFIIPFETPASAGYVSTIDLKIVRPYIDTELFQPANFIVMV